MKNNTFFLSYVLLFTVLSCHSASTRDDIVIRITNDTLKSYRGISGLKIAILNENGSENQDNGSAGRLMNTVFKTVFDDGRFGIVERDMLKRVLDEISLQQTGIVSAGAINKIGELSGAQLVMIVRIEEPQIDMRIISAATGEILAFASGHLQSDSPDHDKPVSNYERLKQKYLSMKCGNQTTQSKEIIIASLNSYPEEKREFYLMGMIESCNSQNDEEKNKAVRDAKIKEMMLESKTVTELEALFINKDSVQYPSKATRKLIISQFRKSYLTDLPAQNPAMKQYYKDLYSEELMKLIVSE